MVHAAVFTVVGITLLSLAVSHPTSDYRIRKNLISDLHLHAALPRISANDELLKPQTKQGFGAAFAPFLAAFLTPLVTTFTNGLTSTFENGLSSPGGRNKTSDNAEGIVANSGESTVPYVYFAQSVDDSPVTSALPHGAPLGPPFVASLESSFASPLAAYPALTHGNAHHFISSHQILVPLFPSPEDSKHGVKCLSDRRIDNSFAKLKVREST